MLTEEELDRLAKAAEDSYRQMERFREKRLEALREYCGFHYSENAAQDKVPLNLLFQAVQALVRHLVPKNPKALVTTRIGEIGPQTDLLELALNHTLKEVDFRTTLERAAFDAMFGMGIFNVGMYGAAKVEFDGTSFDIGQPFVEHVDVEDFVFDMSAKRWDKVTFVGHRMRVPLEQLKQSGMFDEEAVADLQPMVRTNHNESGDEKVEVISRGNEADPEEFVDMVEVWNLYLPLQNRVVSIPAGPHSFSGPVKKLRDVEYEGPEEGPYVVLGFYPVPGTLLYVPPVAVMRDLHDSTNRIARKIIRQGERSKTIGLVPPGAEDDAQRIVDASDGEVIKTSRPEAVTELTFGGSDPALMQLAMYLRQQFSDLNGNIDLLAGLGPQSETLGQDEMLAANASKQVQVMQEAVTIAVTKVYRRLAWFLWHDPLIELPLSKRIEGTSLPPMEVVFSEETREGDFLDYNIDIEPYGMQEQSPAQRANEMMELLVGVLLQAPDMLMQQGIMVDFEKFLRLYGKYKNMPELNEILMYANPQYAPEAVGLPQRGDARPKMPKTGDRRVASAGQSRQGQTQVMMQNLAGMIAQQGKAA